MYRHASTCLKNLKSRRPIREQEESRKLSVGIFGDHQEHFASSGEESALRWELIARVRQEIAEGVYDTPDKWEAALDRLQERLLGD
jgi:hypothetical protein